MRVAITVGGIDEASVGGNTPELLLSSREHSALQIEERLTGVREGKPAFLVPITPPTAEAAFFLHDKTVRFLPKESVVRIGERSFFVARLEGGGFLNRLEEERSGVEAAVLWNDLPFGLTQCALEIDALALSKKLALPLFWISTHWLGKGEMVLHRRGYWVTNANGEIVKSEHQAQFAGETFDLPTLLENTPVFRNSPGLDPSQMGMKVVRTLQG